METKKEKESSAGTIGLVLGIIGLSLSFIPILNNASIFLGILAIISGIVAFAKKVKKGKVIATIILGVLSMVAAIALQNSWSKSLDNITGDNTDEVLKNLNVEIGTLEVSEKEYGLVDTKLVVKVTNKASEKKSYSIKIEAVGPDGNRIDDDTIYVSDLGAGQSQEFDLFTYISSDKLEAMKAATFNIVDASMY